MSKKKMNGWALGIVLALIIFSSFIVIIATYLSSQKYELVSQTYYEETIDYENTIKQRQATAQLNAKPTVDYISSEQKLSITFPSYESKIDSGTVSCYRADNAKLDTRQKLQLDENGKMALDAADLKNGWWKVTLAWSMAGKEYFIESDVRI